MCFCWFTVKDTLHTLRVKSKKGWLNLGWSSLATYSVKPVESSKASAESGKRATLPSDPGETGRNPSTDLVQYNSFSLMIIMGQMPKKT